MEKIKEGISKNPLLIKIAVGLMIFITILHFHTTRYNVYTHSKNFIRVHDTWFNEITFYRISGTVHSNFNLGD